MVGRKTGFDGFARELLEPRDRTFESVPDKIQNADRYSVFKVLFNHSFLLHLILHMGHF